MAEQLSETIVLARYFNTEDDPAGYVKKKAGEFAHELRQLTDSDKTELATLAAAEMGVELKPVAAKA